MQYLKVEIDLKFLNIYKKLYNRIQITNNILSIYIKDFYSMNNKKDLNAKSHLMEKFKEIKEVEKETPPICEFCGKSIVGTKWNKKYHHINITQTPEKRFFCSRQCKIKWIFENS